jgi:hypothetical protein
MEGGPVSPDGDERDDGLTYAEAGVDIDASEAATFALVEAIGDVGGEGVEEVGSIVARKGKERGLELIAAKERQARPLRAQRRAVAFGFACVPPAPDGAFVRER